MSDPYDPTEDPGHVIDAEPTQAVAVRDPQQAIERAQQPEHAKPPVTAAQAKVEAVASLTFKAYERASTLTLTPDETKKLQADFPDEAFKPGAAGKENLIYIEHAYLRDRLNEVFGLGQWAIIPRNRWAEDFRTSAGKPASRVYVEAMLMVRGAFVAEAVGEMEYYPNNASQNYGDAVEGAKTACLRRCCKEFGIGLQAWKKDWCEGWWARKRNPGKASPHPSQPKASAPASPKPAAPAAANAGPTPAHKARLIELLGTEDGLPVALEFFQKVNAILPNEGLDDIPLDFVPATKDQMDGLMRSIGSFAAGDEARLPYPRHRAQLVAKPAAKAAPAKAAPVNVNRSEPATDAQAEPWYDVIIPIPRKGQKRDAYMQAPDTIGSLYESRHGTDEESQTLRQRLWGFVTNWQPSGWTKRDGTEMPPSDADIKCREALDQFSDWFEKTHPDEKL